MNISYLIVVRNEAGLLAQRLREIDPFVDDVVVVHDGEPDDDSVEVARKFTDRVIVAPYQGYCEPQRQVGLEACTGDWVLVGDADEEFTQDFRTMLYHWAKVAMQHGCDGVMLNRLETNLDGEVTRHCRYFRREKAHFSDIIHSNVQGLGQVLELPDHQFVHHSRTDGAGGDPAAVREKTRRYAAIQARLREKYADQPEVLAAHLSVEYVEPPMDADNFFATDGTRIDTDDER